jgi:hypothetical protein
MKKIVFFLLLLIVNWLIADIQIGNGTETSHHLPMYPYYEYTYSQVIYYATEINASGSISAIDYQAVSAAGYGPDNIIVYMATTDLCTFENNPSGIPFAILTQVYNGTITVPAGGGVVRITLDVPFPYDGSQNLVIAFDENSSGYHSITDSFYCTNKAEATAILYYNDYTNPNPQYLSQTMTLINGIANVNLVGLTPYLEPPAPILPFPADNSIHNSQDVTFHWTGYFSDTYDLYFNGELIAPDLTESSFQYEEALEYSTTHYWYVVAKNENGNSTSQVWSFTIMDDPTITSFPHTEGFEGATFPPVGWAVINNNGDARTWTESPGYSNSGSKCAMIDTDLSPTNDDYLITPPIVLTGQQRLKFWVRPYSVNEPDEISVLLSTTTPEVSAFTEVVMPSTLINSLSYQLKVVDLSSYSGTVYLSFTRRNAPADGWRLFLDDILIEDIPQSPPLVAVNPSPVDEAINQEIDVNLAWDYISDTFFADGFYVSIGTDNPPTNIVNNFDNGISKTYDLPLLDIQTTYYWQVVPYNIYGSADDCPIWSFSTLFVSVEHPNEYALDFDGVNDYLTIPHHDAYNVTTVTLEMWVKWQSGLQFLLGKAIEQLEIHTSSNNSLRFIPTTGVYLDTPPNSFIPNEWHHIAFVYEPANSYHKCYIDGNEISLAISGPNPITSPLNTSSSPFSIGTRGGGAYYFSEQLCQFRMWSDVRSLSEIQNNMFSQLTGNEDGLVAYFPMNEGTGTALIDHSSISNNGTIFEAQWISYSSYFSMGMGTEQNPWQIFSPTELHFVRHYLGESNSNKYFKLMNNIDLNFYLSSGGNGYSLWGASGWLPIGNETTPFFGNFDGNNKTINNLMIDRNTSYNGLFGYVENASIHNLHLSDAEINSEGMYCGVLSGKSVNSNLDQCSVSGEAQGLNYSGGVAGWFENGEINNCFSSVNVNSDDEDVEFQGGFLGQTTGVEISNSYAIGSVKGADNIGGFIGNSTNCNIQQSYSIGLVNGDVSVGGFIGSGSSNTINQSFWDMGTSTQTNSAGGTGKTTLEMQNFFTYFNAGWDFLEEDINGTNNIWGFNQNQNNGYPFLQWQDFAHFPPSLFFAYGSGTENDPWQIFTPTDLNNIRNYCGPLHSNKYFKLMNDIDLTDYLAEDGEGYNHWGTAGWLPIGAENNRFYGNFDGDYHVITGLQMNRPNDNFIGMFGAISNSTISNLGMEEANVTGYVSVGILVGDVFESTVNNCYSTGLLEAYDCGGGLIGFAWQLTSINRCYSSATMNSQQLSSSYIGGLVGAIQQTTSIYNSYALGDVFATSHGGGLIGSASSSQIYNSYSVGAVNGFANIGGLIGNSNNMNIFQSFWDIETSEQLTSSGGTGRETFRMKNVINYREAGWDLMNETLNGTDDIWGMNPEVNSGYPFLAWQGHSNVSFEVFDFEGEGTQSNPWQIDTAEKLAELHFITGYDYTDKYFKLVNDIDLTDYLAEGGEGYNKWGTSGWKPIGEELFPFMSNLDGNGYKIIGLKIHRPLEDVIGFIGYGYNALIINIGFENSSISGKESVGILAAYLNLSTINGIYSSGSIAGNTHVGGLIGTVENCIISNSYSLASVAGINYVGGFSGFNSGSTISYCYSVGSVAGLNDVGGFIGYSEAVRNSVISSFWNRQTSGQNTSAGGTAKTTLQMKQQATYSDWDFSNVWSIESETNNGYPYLKWQDPIGSLLPPENIQLSISNGIVHLTWDAASDATRYKVLSSNNPSGNFTEDENGTYNGLNWSAPVSGKTLFFKVVSVKD